MAFLRGSVAGFGAWAGRMLCLGLVGGAVVIGGCSRQVAAPNVLAKVGGREITIEDFEQEVQWRMAHGLTLPGKKELLDELINRELGVQKARAAGLEKKFEVRRSHEDTLIAALQRSELLPRLESIAVSPEEIRAAYEKELSRYTRPAKARLALIYVKANDKMSKTKLAELEALMANARQEASAISDLKNGFGPVALKYSEDQASRYRGGDVGWFDDGQPAYSWPKVVIAAGLQLKPGGLSGLIQAEDGFYLVAKTDFREVGVIPLEQVQSALERQILAEKKAKAGIDFNRELQRLAAVQTHPQALTKAAYPTAAVAKSETSAPPMLPRSP